MVTEHYYTVQIVIYSYLDYLWRHVLQEIQQFHVLQVHLVVLLVQVVLQVVQGLQELQVLQLGHYLQLPHEARVVLLIQEGQMVQEVQGALQVVHVAHVVQEVLQLSQGLP